MFLALAGGAFVGLAGCADSDPDSPGTDDPGTTTTAASSTDAATDHGEAGTTTADTTTAETASPTPTETTNATTSETTVETPRAPSISLLALISNEGEYEPGDVEREAIDEVTRGERVALAARYRITVHDGNVSVRFVMTIDDPEGFTAEYPPVDRGRDGLPSGYNEYEFHQEFATDEFRPGEYTVTLEITDRIADRSTTETTTFTVVE